MLLNSIFFVHSLIICKNLYILIWYEFWIIGTVNLCLIIYLIWKVFWRFWDGVFSLLSFCIYKNIWFMDMRRTQYEVPIPSFCYIFVFIDNIMNINCGATLYKILVLQCLWPPPIWCMETSVTLETSQFSEIMKTLRVFIPNVVEKHLPCKLRIIIVYKRLHLIFKF